MSFSYFNVVGINTIYHITSYYFIARRPIIELSALLVIIKQQRFFILAICYLDLFREKITWLWLFVLVNGFYTHTQNRMCQMHHKDDMINTVYVKQTLSMSISFPVCVCIVWLT
jgi:hypothetical protein